MSNTRPVTQMVLWAVVVTFAMALCVTGAQTTMMRDPKTIVVTVSPTNPPKVSMDPVVVSKRYGDEVEWSCPDCMKGFQVHFPKGSPFNSEAFDQTNAYSGRARPTATERIYHYAVTVNGHTLDPGVKVTP